MKKLLVVAFAPVVGAFLFLIHLIGLDLEKKKGTWRWVSYTRTIPVRLENFEAPYPVGFPHSLIAPRSWNYNQIRAQTRARAQAAAKGHFHQTRPQKGRAVHRWPHTGKWA